MFNEIKFYPCRWLGRRTDDPEMEKAAGFPPSRALQSALVFRTCWVPDYPGGRSVLSCALGLNCVHSTMGLIPLNLGFLLRKVLKVSLTLGVCEDYLRQ